jgi:XTP/dITP diphosphohydrolase
MTNLRILYLASSNRGKLLEFRQAAAPCGFEVRVLPGMDRIPPCVEDGTTFEENARKKALYYSGTTRAMVFADDSGISVEALGGAPGIRSARFAGPNATDTENNARLLRELAQHPGARRSACYVCWIALAARQQILGVFEGEVAGAIVDTPKGLGGFGYDPYFYYPPLGKTFAELTSDEKFQVSHRGHAFRKLLSFLASQNTAPGFPAASPTS